jgi:hypothetical protein
MRTLNRYSVTHEINILLLGENSMKKLLCIVLSFAFAAGLVSASGNKQEGGQSGTASGKEITEIVWQYPSPGDLGPGFQDMEDALNAMMERANGSRYGKLRCPCSSRRCWSF